MSFNGSPAAADNTDFEIDFVVKLGGSAITKKSLCETIELGTLCRAADVLMRCYSDGLRFIVAHGAGSFGHDLAKQYNVATGYESKPADEQNRIKNGFALVRQSVLKPCGAWTTDDCHVVRHGCDVVRNLLTANFVPVLHGDCVLDTYRGCSLLSSDTILKVCCSTLKIKRAVFLMDCAGVFTLPPSTPGAELIHVLEVDENGTVSRRLKTSPSTDTTGGMDFKLNSAAAIAADSRGRVPVLLCSVDTEAFSDACLYGEWRGNSVGTIVTFCER